MQKDELFLTSLVFHVYSVHSVKKILTTVGEGSKVQEDCT